MDGYILNSHTFLSGVSASTATSWYPVDWRLGADQLRSIIGSKSSTDEVVLELRNSTVISTATAWVSGVTNFQAVIQGPFTDVRIRKVGAGGQGVTVEGLL